LAEKSQEFGADRPYAGAKTLPGQAPFLSPGILRRSLPGQSGEAKVDFEDSPGKLEGGPAFTDKVIHCWSGMIKMLG